MPAWWKVLESLTGDTHVHGNFPVTSTRVRWAVPVVTPKKKLEKIASSAFNLTLHNLFYLGLRRWPKVSPWCVAHWRYCIRSQCCADAWTNTISGGSQWSCYGSFSWWNWNWSFTKKWQERTQSSEYNPNQSRRNGCFDCFDRNHLHPLRFPETMVWKDSGGDAPKTSMGLLSSQASNGQKIDYDDKLRLLGSQTTCLPLINNCFMFPFLRLLIKFLSYSHHAFN